MLRDGAVSRRRDERAHAVALGVAGPVAFCELLEQAPRGHRAPHAACPRTKAGGRAYDPLTITRRDDDIGALVNACDPLTLIPIPFDVARVPLGQAGDNAVAAVRPLELSEADAQEDAPAKQLGELLLREHVPKVIRRDKLPCRLSAFRSRAVFKRQREPKQAVRALPEHARNTVVGKHPCAHGRRLRETARVGGRLRGTDLRRRPLDSRPDARLARYGDSVCHYAREERTRYKKNSGAGFDSAAIALPRASTSSSCSLPVPVKFWTTSRKA